jgi:hypothetical protein
MNASKAWFGAVVVALGAWSLTPSAGAVEPRPHARPNPAAVALAAHAFPGMALEWPGWLTVPNGPPEVLRLGEFRRLLRGERWWLVLHMDVIGRPERAADEPGAEASRGMFVVAQTDAQGRVLAHKTLHVDSTARDSAALAADFSGTRRAGWPSLRISAWSAGENRAHAAQVWWSGEFDSQTGGWVWRWPSAYWHVAPDGSQRREALRALAIDQGAAGDMLVLVGVESGRRFSFPCPGGLCDVRPLALLDQLR